MVHASIASWSRCGSVRASNTAMLSGGVSAGAPRGRRHQASTRDGDEVQGCSCAAPIAARAIARARRPTHGTGQIRVTAAPRFLLHHKCSCTFSRRCATSSSPGSARPTSERPPRVSRWARGRSRKRSPAETSMRPSSSRTMRTASSSPTSSGSRAARGRASRCRRTSSASPTELRRDLRGRRGDVGHVPSSKPADVQLTFHLSPGTPAMAAVWIILGKTRFPAELIESSREHGVRTVLGALRPLGRVPARSAPRADGDLKAAAAGAPPEAPSSPTSSTRAA